MAKNDIHFWSGGVSWNNIRKLDDFKKNHNWQIGWDKNSTSQGAKQAWENIKKVKPNDFLAFHGYGGKNDLTIYQISKILKKDEEKGILYLQQLSDDNAQLFHNKAPKMEQGGWFGTLFQVTGNEAINAIFGNYLKTNNKQMQEIQQLTNLITDKINIILQGAPGVGKTYTTAALALAICDGIENVPDNHDDVMKCYEELQKEGRIGFVTFHQSMDYEDFVEGIKPQIINEDKMIYKVEDGIFKQLCLNANKITANKKSNKVDFTKQRVFKMSLGEKGKDDNIVFDYCFDNNVVALGWGDNNDFSNCSKLEDFKAIDNTWGAIAMTIFKQWMRIGDIVLISDGTKAVKAIAKIVGQYEFHNDTPINMCQFRKVEWLYNGDLIPISKLYDKNLSQQSIYGFFNSQKEGSIDYNGSIKVDVINDIITGNINSEKTPNYVLIIDEINRGNVSKIFGELITLLEADKRIGGNHPLKVTLPYSKTEFGVPSNLYIIGTMNTTDRSVGNIDYAVRRRFAFVTIKADKNVLIEKYGENSLQVNLFNTVNQFVDTNNVNELDIEDLKVGHSFFMVDDVDKLQLNLDYEIIPLIKEYIKDGLLKSDGFEKEITNWQNMLK